MHLGGKYKISLSNDALESFLQIRALCAPHESITSQGAMAERVKNIDILTFCLGFSVYRPGLHCTVSYPEYPQSP